MSLLTCVALYYLPVAPAGAPLKDHFGHGFLTGNGSVPESFDATLSPLWVLTGESERIHADQHLPEFTPCFGPPATTGPVRTVHDVILPPHGMILDDPSVDPLTPLD